MQVFIFAKVIPLNPFNKPSRSKGAKEIYIFDIGYIGILDIRPHNLQVTIVQCTDCIDFDINEQTWKRKTSQKTMLKWVKS